MDAREWDRIADLLMQIRKKYAQLDPNWEVNQMQIADALDSINALLWINDQLAERDGKGWL